MEVNAHNRCCICGKIIMEQYLWNPEVKEKKVANFRPHTMPLFDPSKNLFCPNCYEKLKYTVKGDKNEDTAHKG